MTPNEVKIRCKRKYYIAHLTWAYYLKMATFDELLQKTSKWIHIQTKSIMVSDVSKMIIRLKYTNKHCPFPQNACIFDVLKL